MPTNAEIQNWLRQNPGASDAQIAAAARQHGVGSQQISQVTGVPLQQVQQRAAAVGGAGGDQVRNAGASTDLTPYRNALSGGVTDDLIRQGIGALNSGQLNEGDIASLMAQFGIKPQDISRATGASPQEIAQRALAFVENKPQGLQAPQLSSLASAIAPLFRPDFLSTNGGNLSPTNPFTGLGANRAGGLLSQFINGSLTGEQAQIAALNSFGRNIKDNPSQPGTYLEQVGPDQWVTRQGPAFSSQGRSSQGLPLDTTLPAWYQGPLQDYISGLTGGQGQPAGTPTNTPPSIDRNSFNTSPGYNSPQNQQQRGTSQPTGGRVNGVLTPSQQQLAQYINLVGQLPQAQLAGVAPELQLLDRLRQLQMMSPLALSGLESAFAGVPHPAYGIPDFSTLALNMLGIPGVTGQSLLEPLTFLTPANAAYFGQPAPYLTAPWIPQALGGLPGLRGAPDLLTRPDQGFNQVPRDRSSTDAGAFAAGQLF